ncbi:MAG: twin-arginine translocase subunit TatC [Gammaproteobacteria bacterium]|nr:twin-arginine translocase subunit TatC [Gammaproteobacteria bacterium]
MTDKERPLLSHLVELRSRLLKMIACIGLFFIILFPFANPLYNFLSAPLIAQLPQGGTMIAIDVASPFLAPFKLVLLLAVSLSIPVLVYQFWAFVSPGLYRQEKRLALPILLSSTLLFYVGMVFAYYIVFPLMFGFFSSVAPEGISLMTDINRYLNFVIKIFIAFGVAFEVPIITLMLVKTGVTTTESLIRKRPYIIVGAFVVGMILTPPDVISQILLAIPIWLLFEIGILICKFSANTRARETAPLKEQL